MTITILLLLVQDRFLFTNICRNRIEYNCFKIFMQVGVDVKCMHTKFGGHGLSRNISFQPNDLILFSHSFLKSNDYSSYFKAIVINFGRS